MDLNRVDTFVAERVKLILADHPDVKLAALADLCLYDESEISRFLNGDRRMPVDFFRALIRATKDERLVRLLVGSEDCHVQFAKMPRAADRPCIHELLPIAISTLRNFQGSLAALQAMVADNRIDQLDASRCLTFSREATECIGQLSGLIASVEYYADKSAQDAVAQAQAFRNNGRAAR